MSILQQGTEKRGSALHLNPAAPRQCLLKRHEEVDNRVPMPWEAAPVPMQRLVQGVQHDQSSARVAAEGRGDGFARQLCQGLQNAPLEGDLRPRLLHSDRVQVGIDSGILQELPGIIAAQGGSRWKEPVNKAKQTNEQQTEPSLEGSNNESLLHCYCSYTPSTRPIHSETRAAISVQCILSLPPFLPS